MKDGLAAVVVYYIRVAAFEAIGSYFWGIFQWARPPARRIP